MTITVEQAKQIILATLEDHHLADHARRRHSRPPVHFVHFVHSSVRHRGIWHAMDWLELVNASRIPAGGQPTREALRQAVND